MFGGGNGDITDGTVTSADILGNTNVILEEDDGGGEQSNGKQKDDSFSINVIWFKMWDPVKNIFYIWDPDIDSEGDEPATEDTVYEKSKFYADGKFLNPHNIYGGGNLACNVGTYKDADGNVTTSAADGTGLATVMMQKGMTPYELLITDEWKQSYTDNENPHFSVFGGGYGRLTTVGSTDVTVNVDGDYGKYNPDHDGHIDPDFPLLDLSKGVPNFTVWAVPALWLVTPKSPSTARHSSTVCLAADSATSRRPRTTPQVRLEATRRCICAVHSPMATCLEEVPD